MTQTKKIVILDTSASRVIFTTCEHNTSDDMEVAVYDRMDELNLNQNTCDWMELPIDERGNPTIETDYPLQISAINN